MDLRATKDEVSGIWTLDGCEPWTETFTTMIENLKVSKDFKFARYGDGEIYCMNGRNGKNCDGHFYFPTLSMALHKAISPEPEYMVGIQPLSVQHFPKDVDNYFGNFHTLYNADALHNASLSGSLKQFTAALEGRYIILVGPAHLASFFAQCVHIVIPNDNCWTEYTKIKQQIEFHIDGVNNAVVILAASMMSEVLISNFEDAPHTFIDVGSVLDPYCGVKSRRYHFKLNV
jgi:hypothetical protein